MYRPDGWKNPHNPEASVFPDEVGWTCVRREHDAYEAGADTMLEAMIEYMDKHFGYDYSGVRTRELRGKV